jgi:molecular chaperone HscC
MIFGIDLGTTNSLIACMAAEMPVIIPLADGERLLPSVIAQDDGGQLLVGRPGRERMRYAPQSGVARFKTAMGTRQVFTLGSSTFTPTALSSVILSQLKQAAEAHTGETVRDVVITVPAYFKESQRSATAEAGQLAGLTVRRIINEPTAAAIAYGLHTKQADRRIAVIDLGGGTFDVSVLDIFEGIAEVSATSGDTVLGGEDFTDNLTAALLRQLGLAKLEETAPQAYGQFRARCEQAKLELSSAKEVVLGLGALPRLGARGEQQVTVTTEFFESLNTALLQRMDHCILDALRQAKCAPTDIDEILMVGGASRMPCVARLVAERFGKPGQNRVNPDEIVALGAAVQAGLIEGHAAVGDYVVTDITPFSLGVRACRDGGIDNRYFIPVIHRGETVPVSRQEPFWTVRPEQNVVRIEVFQGDRRIAEENEFLGDFNIECPPPPGLPPQNRQIDVRFTLDLSGLLEVEATVTKTGKRARVIIERGAGRMSEAERQSAIEALERLKVHPRDLLPNRHLLERANHLYATLPRVQKEIIDDLLLQFEQALKAQDNERIRTCRQLLEQAVKNLSG